MRQHQRVRVLEKRGLLPLLPVNVACSQEKSRENHPPPLPPPPRATLMIPSATGESRQGRLFWSMMRRVLDSPSKQVRPAATVSGGGSGGSRGRVAASSRNARSAV